MSVVQNQEVDAEVQADVAAAPVDATVQSETVETPAQVAETPTKAVETPLVVASPEVKTETTKKRTTTPKATKTAETPEPAVVMQTVAPVVETPVVVQAETLELASDAENKPEDEAPAPVQDLTAPVKAPVNGFSWGSKRKEKQAKESAEQPCEIEVTNTGAHSFESYTRTPLPSNQAVIVVCDSSRLRAAIVSKLNKLNQLAGVTRYIILAK